MEMNALKCSEESKEFLNSCFLTSLNSGLTIMFVLLIFLAKAFSLMYKGLCQLSPSGKYHQN